MHYLSGNVYSLKVAACDLLVSIYRFFNIWLFNTIGSGLLLLLLPLSVCAAQCMCSSELSVVLKPLAKLADFL